MSIEMDNPKTILEKLDAAANYAAQIRIALMIGDKARVDFALSKIDDLLFEAKLQIEDEEGGQP